MYIFIYVCFPNCLGKQNISTGISGTGSRVGPLSDLGHRPGACSPKMVPYSGCRDLSMNV